MERPVAWTFCLCADTLGVNRLVRQVTPSVDYVYRVSADV